MQGLMSIFGKGTTTATPAGRSCIVEDFEGKLVVASTDESGQLSLVPLDKAKHASLLDLQSRVQTTIELIKREKIAAAEEHARQVHFFSFVWSSGGLRAFW